MYITRSNLIMERLPLAKKENQCIITTVLNTRDDSVRIQPRHKQISECTVYWCTAKVNLFIQQTFPKHLLCMCQAPGLMRKMTWSLY